MKDVRAVILAGGLGARLRPYTYAVPKPLLPIGERPIIEITLRWLQTQGITDVAIALGWRGNIVKAFVGDGSQYGLKVNYVQEEKRLGTAGPLSQLLDWAGASDVFVINGDIMTKLRLADMLKFHKEHQADITVASRYHKTQSPFGVLTVDGKTNGVVRQVDEKPTRLDLVSCGMYILSPVAIATIPVNQRFDIPELIYRFLIQSDRPDHIRTYTFDEPWIAIEQLNELQDIDQSWLDWADHLEHRAMQLQHTNPERGALI